MCPLQAGLKDIIILMYASGLFKKSFVLSLSLLISHLSAMIETTLD